jgi:hypothetical protein
MRGMRRRRIWSERDTAVAVRPICARNVAHLPLFTGLVTTYEASVSVVEWWLYGRATA